MLTALLNLVRPRPACDQAIGYATSGSSSTRQATATPKLWPLTSPIDMALVAAFVTLGLRVVLPNAAILGSKQFLVSLFQTSAQATMDTLRSIDPKGRPVLFLMALFCGWFVGAMVLWPEEERNVSLTSVQKEILALCHRLSRAEVTHDELTMATLLHDQFMFTDDQGKTIDKAQFLILSRQFHVASQELSAEPPRVTNSRAFVEGTATLLPRSAGEEAIAYRFSTCFAKTDGGWKAVEQKIYTPLRGTVSFGSRQQVAA